MKDVILQANRICKSFPGVRANHNIDLTLYQGEVLALLGENGAGKSTLMNILYGFYQPDSGEILIRGKQVTIDSPSRAIELGIGMVHQHFMLVPVFTVLENIILGLDLKKGLFVDQKRCRKELNELSEQYGLSIDLDKKVADLSIGEQQRVEILKTLYRKVDILILDEPTAVLTPQESEDLFRVLHRFRESGKSILFISHKMDELMQFSDRIVVLRAGESVGEFQTKDTSIEALASCMVGRQVHFVKNTAPRQQAPVQVVVEDLHVDDSRGVEAVRGVSLELAQGEILGLAGVDGNGQSELAEALMGLRQVKSGRIVFQGKDVANQPTRKLQEAGFAHIPADRKAQGLVPDYSVAQNLVLSDIHSSTFSHWGFIRHRSVSKHAEQMIQEYDIRPPLQKQQVKHLSGGNQQKVIIAREFDKAPHFLVAVNPIRGVDICATEFIHHKLTEQKQAGTSILLISTDLEEIMDISDRIAVIFHGKIVGIVDPRTTSREEIGLMMTGIAKQEGEKKA